MIFWSYDLEFDKLILVILVFKWVFFGDAIVGEVRFLILVGNFRGLFSILGSDGVFLGKRVFWFAGGFGSILVVSLSSNYFF